MRPWMKRNFKQHWPGRQQGAVIVLLTVAMIALLAMAGLALDGGHLLLNKTRLQNAVDAAALSAAKTLNQMKGQAGSEAAARSAAQNTLQLNANAVGNAELSDAIGDGGGVGGFATVEFASTIYGPFSTALPADGRYVRVTVPEYGLVGFFWNFLQSIGSRQLEDKAVAAVAVAGWSATQPCKIEPLLVCGDPNPAAYDPENGLYWGYQRGNVSVLKSAAQNDSVIGPGNFQLLDFGSGGNTIRDGLAGGIEDCNIVGDYATTEPGNKVGPVAQGLNTRFGDGSTTEYPRDHVIDYTHQGNKVIEYDGTTVSYNGSAVQADSDGHLTAGATSLFDYNDWLESYSQANCPGDNCSLPGAPDRRILNIVIGDCTGKLAGEFNGKSDIPVLGFACYYTLQPVQQGGGGGSTGGGTGSSGGSSSSGQTSQIFGQFVSECNGDNVPSNSPWDDSGPVVIQLYKAYINGVSTPSPDS